MALLKSIDLPTGFSASYWRITALSINFERWTGTIHVLGYKDQTLRNSGNGTELSRRDVAIAARDFEHFFGPAAHKNVLACAYEYLVGTPEFSQAKQA